MGKVAASWFTIESSFLQCNSVPNPSQLNGFFRGCLFSSSSSLSSSSHRCHRCRQIWYIVNEFSPYLKMRDTHALTHIRTTTVFLLLLLKFRIDFKGGQEASSKWMSIIRFIIIFVCAWTGSHFGMFFGCVLLQFLFPLFISIRIILVGWSVGRSVCRLVVQTFFSIICMETDSEIWNLSSNLHSKLNIHFWFFSTKKKTICSKMNNKSHIIAVWRTQMYVIHTFDVCYFIFCLRDSFFTFYYFYSPEMLNGSVVIRLRQQ